MANRIEAVKPTGLEAAIKPGEQSPIERRPRDLRTLRRIVTAISIVLAPLAVSIVRATVPLASSSGGKAAIAAAAANLDMARVELTAGVVATLFLPFAIVGLTRLVMRRAPVLAILGGSLALVGWALVPSLVTSDAVTYEMARLGSNSTQFAALWEQLNGNFAVSMLFSVFIIGHRTRAGAGGAAVGCRGSGDRHCPASHLRYHRQSARRYPRLCAGDCWLCGHGTRCTHHSE
jgi:hypothetical protein